MFDNIIGNFHDRQYWHKTKRAPLFDKIDTGFPRGTKELAVTPVPPKSSDAWIEGGAQHGQLKTSESPESLGWVRHVRSDGGALEWRKCDMSGRTVRLFEDAVMRTVFWCARLIAGDTWRHEFLHHDGKFGGASEEFGDWQKIDRLLFPEIEVKSPHVPWIEQDDDPITETEPQEEDGWVLTEAVPKGQRKWIRAGLAVMHDSTWGWRCAKPSDFNMYVRQSGILANKAVANGDWAFDSWPLLKAAIEKVLY